MSFPSNPSHIKPSHWEEWVLNSCINPSITTANLVSLKGNEPYERLFYSDGIKRLNTGRLPSWILKKYSHIEKGGWWAGGIDPITGEDHLWGCYKPDQPRIDSAKGKYQKYEHPLKATASAFFLQIPWEIGLKIATRYGLASEYSLRKSNSSNSCIDNKFWQWVISHPQVNITLTEGVKKAAAILSQGIVAIGLPGIWGAYRKNFGKPSLIPELEPFTSGDRQFFFAFDQDEKRQTRQTNRKALQNTTNLLRAKNCMVSIIIWEPWIKGVDDLIYAKGAEYFLVCYSKALTYEDWQADGLKELTYETALRLASDTKYLEDFAPPPSAKLICVKAPKGSGKTEWLVRVCADAQSRGQKVIVITHRQQLGQALCARFGIDYVSELKDSDTQGIFGFGLCFDSLRRNSQSRFDPDDWHGCIVILDECEQSVWHLLNARTEVAKHRVEVLRNFQQLIQNTLESDEGRVYLSDADLSDLSIDYVRSLANFPVEPWIAIKEGNPTPWNVTVWETCNELLGALTSHIRVENGKPLIFVDGQKARSKWGTQNLEAYLADLFPDLRILRIDAESIADPNHPAFGCIDKLNEVLPLYDLAIASPSIETGVSIDIKGHFTSIWDIAQGVVPVASILQRMARLREPVPRHMWAKGFGIGRIANGATSPRKLMSSQQIQFKAHVKLLAESEFPVDFEVASSFQPQSIRTWAMMAARINLGMVRYRHEILRALVAEGHSISTGNYLEVLAEDQEATGTDQIKDDLTESRDKIYDEHCSAVSQAPSPDEKRYETLSKKQARTNDELKELRKGELSRRYSEELVNSELVKLDDDGEYSKMRLHYYLTIGRAFLSARDKQVAEKHLESGKGELFLPDINRSLLGGKIKYLEALNIKDLLESGTEWSNDSQALIDLSIKSQQYKDGIKAVLGVSITEKDTPIRIAQKFLRQCLGLAFDQPIKRGAKGNQQRYYQAVEVPELRQQILEVWLARDEAAKLAQQATATIDNEMGSITPSLDGYEEVGSTGNIYRSSDVPTEDTASHSPAYSLVELLATVSTAVQMSAVIDRSLVDEVEDAISMQDSQPQRNLLQGLLRQTLRLKEIANQLLGGFSLGVEALKEMLKPLNFDQRWEVFQLLEKVCPEAMESLVKIAPNWYEFCLVR